MNVAVIPRTERAWRAWTCALQSARFRARAVATGVALGGTMTLLSFVLSYVERRTHVVRLDDPVLARLPSHDFTWLIFGLIYLGLTMGLVELASSPRALLRGVQAYLVLMLFRSVTLTLTPLAAPPGMILLVDPFARHVVSGPALTKDLFFSGHTSTLFLLHLVSRDRRLKTFFLASTFAVGVAVLFQHVHYTIDVLAAPAFAYASFTIALRLSARPSRVRDKNSERSSSASARETDS